MALTPGVRLGPYEILSALGAGGMGEVYKASDTRLDRTVAIKILPDVLAADSQFRDRFDREARTISQLDHPHICALYDVGEERGTAYLVMQYLEGETLADRLTKGALPLDQALRIAIQIADALATAHKAGIVHRDLKPGNVMLTKGGAKLLDFGLAKTSASALSGTNLSMLPTTPPITQQGAILGTFQYMAPEQFEGQEADARTDIFAFGAVVYEMVTGKKAFEGKSQASLIGAIMTREPPPIVSLQPLTPPALGRAVARCLAKEPQERWQSVCDISFVLADALEAAPQTANATRSGPKSVAAAALIAAGAVAALIIQLRSRPVAEAGESIRFAVPAPNGETLASASAADGPVSVSPDGRYLTFTTISPQATRRHLWVRALNSLEARPLAGTDNAAWPSWSPDSRFILFTAGAQLKKVELSSGIVRTICASPGAVRGSSWGDNDTILFAAFRVGLFRVAADGGTPVPVTTVDPEHEALHEWPQFLPDGRHFIFTIDGDGRHRGVFVASLDSPDRTRLVDAPANAAYAGGFLLYRGDTPTLMAQRLNPQTLRLEGEPITLLDDLARGNIDDLHVHFSASHNVLAYQSIPLPGVRLVWFDRTGKQLGVLRDDGEIYVDPEISPDGRYVAVDRIERKTGRIQVALIDVARGTMTRLNPELRADARPIWSKDGRSLIFSGQQKDEWGLFSRNADAGEPLKTITTFSNPLSFASDVWRDSQKVLLMQFQSQRIGSRTGLDMLIVQTEGGVMTPLLADASQGRLSPDEQYVAYISNESGEREIYIRSIAGAGAKRLVSNGGGQSPRWREDGRELFYANGKAIMAVDVRPGSIETGASHPLFEVLTFMNTQPAPTPNGTDFAVSADGRRLLLDLQNPNAPQSPISVVTNWTAALKK